MAFSTGSQTVTLLSPVPAGLASDLGIATGGTGDVLHLPYRDALALVQGGYARFGDNADDLGSTDDEGSRAELLTPAAGGPITAGQTITGPALEAHGADKARLIAGSDQAMTVAIEQSLDGQTWLRPVAATAVTAGGSALLEQGISTRFVRGVLINGGTAGTARAELRLV